MQSLRNARSIARFVLVWFALSLGVAIAAPIVHPQAMQLVCSGSGSVKAIALNVNGKATSTQSHTLDCPLCAGVGAPPPLALVLFTAAAPRAFAPTLRDKGMPPALASAAPPPARGPPARA